MNDPFGDMAVELRLTTSKPASFYLRAARCDFQNFVRQSSLNSVLVGTIRLEHVGAIAIYSYITCYNGVSMSTVSAFCVDILWTDSKENERKPLLAGHSWKAFPPRMTKQLSRRWIP